MPALVHGANGGMGTGERTLARVHTLAALTVAENEARAVDRLADGRDAAPTLR